MNSIVTGGLQGIGRSIVQRLQKRGDRVFVFDCIDASDARVKGLEKTGAIYIQTDISSVSCIHESFAKFDKILQNHALELDTSQDTMTLDLLVNNAGITRDNLAIRMTEQAWDSVLNVNLKGSFFCAQQALLRMIKNKKTRISKNLANGYIINISSIVGKTGNPGQVNYAASKAGIIAMTKTLAQEYASRNILINAIAPGFVETGMTQNLSEKIKNYARERIALKRFGSGDDIANLVAFLSSEQAHYITGQTLDLNGGMF